MRISVGGRPPVPSCFSPALAAVKEALRVREGPLVVAVDGRCASGKTTFAALCARYIEDCGVFHMDDFFLPGEKRTLQRLSQPGGNVDHERALTELFAPLSRGEGVTFSRFDCASGSPEPPKTFPPRRLAIVEGCYSHHPALAPYSGLKLFLTCDPQVQLARLSARAPEKLEDFRTRWIPLEEAYFSAFGIEERSDLVADTTYLKQEEQA